MSLLVTHSTTRAVSALAPLWLDVAQGKGGHDWIALLPADVQAETLALLPSPAHDLSLSVSLQDAATILFTASARAA